MVTICNDTSLIRKSKLYYSVHYNCVIYAGTFYILTVHFVICVQKPKQKINNFMRRLFWKNLDNHQVVLNMILIQIQKCLPTKRGSHKKPSDSRWRPSVKKLKYPYLESINTIIPTIPPWTMRIPEINLKICKRHKNVI